MGAEEVTVTFAASATAEVGVKVTTNPQEAPGASVIEVVPKFTAELGSSSNILKTHVRTTDLIVRYGGDEFLVLLEQITDVEALSIADQIRREVDSSSLQVGLAQELHVSISAGYAAGAASWLELFHKADQSLFKAKAKGKNAVQG